jgi:carnitine 3-dehydrogenase
MLQRCAKNLHPLNFNNEFVVPMQVYDPKKELTLLQHPYKEYGDNMERYKPEEGPIAVIGAGMVGASWAGLFAAHGRQVRLFDNDLQNLTAGVEHAKAHADFLVQHDMTDSNLAKTGLKSLSSTLDLTQAVTGTSIIQEAVVEDLKVKKAVFKEVDRYAPRNALIITSSSGLSISQMQSTTQHPERCLAGHPYNPPHLIPLVEIAPGEKSSPEAVEAARRFYEGLGKVPIVLRREIPGYLANRMSAALWREAVNLSMQDVASVEDIDKAIRYGPGLRWSVIGPNLTYHLGGGKGGIRHHTQHLLNVKEKIWEDLDDWKSFPLPALDILEAGLPDPKTFASLARERDERLMRVIKSLQDRNKTIP